jgi:hypothetical protein
VIPSNLSSEPALNQLPKRGKLQPRKLQPRKLQPRKLQPRMSKKLKLLKSPLNKPN